MALSCGLITQNDELLDKCVDEMFFIKQFAAEVCRFHFFLLSEEQEQEQDGPGEKTTKFETSLAQITRLLRIRQKQIASLVREVLTFEGKQLQKYDSISR